MGIYIDNLKKNISIDLGVAEYKIILLQLSEQLGNAIYIVSVDGWEMKYRRTLGIFLEKMAKMCLK